MSSHRGEQDVSSRLRAPPHRIIRAAILGHSFAHPSLTIADHRVTFLALGSR